MHKLEIQPLVALVFGGCQVLLALLRSHGIPLLRLALVAPDVIGFCQEVQGDVHDVDGQKCAVAAAVPGFVV